MRLACADNTFRLLEPWESVLDLIRLLELDGVDVCLMGNRSHIRPEAVRDDIPAAAARISKGLERRELAVSDLFVIPWTDFQTLAPNHPAAAERARSRMLFEGMLELAIRIGAPGLTMLPGVDWEAERHEDSFQRSVEELGWRAERTRAAGLRLSIEPHLGSIAQAPDEARRLCQQTPDLELTLDYSHFVYQGYAQGAIETLVPHARHFHARGARKGRMQATLRDSVIDFERMVDVMRETGYGGDIGLEYLWIDWEHLNDCDTVSETILLRDRLLAKFRGERWSYPAAAA